MIHQGTILKNLVSEQQITQEEFGKKMGVSRGQVSIYFNKIKLKPAIIEKACKVLKVDKSVFEIPSVNESQIAYNIKGGNNQQYNMGITECAARLEAAEKENLLLRELLKEKDERIADLKERRK
jgi:transcriptional regulator with XRE-family HTH domain